MKFLLISDIHNEFWQDQIELHVPQDTAAILIPGDMSTKGRHVEVLEDIWNRYRVPVVAVMGNHDFYHGVMGNVLAETRLAVDRLQARGVDIRVLDRDVLVIGDVRILGATLWTDLELNPKRIDTAKHVVKKAMADFNRIRLLDTESRGLHRQLSIDDWLEFHGGDWDFLMDELRKPFAGKTLVMTHHSPCREMINPVYLKGDDNAQLLNAGFASDLWPEISNMAVDTWIYGHSHSGLNLNLEGKHGPVKFRTNPRGYPQEKIAFNPQFILEV